MFNFMNKLVMSEAEALGQNVQVLAFVGDAVQTLFVRTSVMAGANTKSGILHTRANKFVSALGQHKIVSALLPTFNKNELAVFKRARNYKTQSLPKNAEISHYKNATGWEAVLGFLYVSGQNDRLNELLLQSYNLINHQ